MSGEPIGDSGDRNDPRRAQLDSLFGDLSEWSAGQRAQEAAAMRSRERWMRHQAAEMTTLERLLADLAASRSNAQLSTAHGRWNGLITAASEELCSLSASMGTVIVVNFHIKGVISHGPAGGSDTSNNPWSSGTPMTLSQALIELASQRADVRILASDSANYSGRVLAAGPEMVTVRLLDRTQLYLRLEAIEAWQHL